MIPKNKILVKWCLDTSLILIPSTSEILCSLLLLSFGFITRWAMKYTHHSPNLFSQLSFLHSKPFSYWYTHFSSLACLVSILYIHISLHIILLSLCIMYYLKSNKPTWSAIPKQTDNFHCLFLIDSFNTPRISFNTMSISFVTCLNIMDPNQE